jgi:PAS domain S-box-containing protein
MAEFLHDKNQQFIGHEKGTIKLVNASAEKLFGYSREELVGRTWRR